jgi:sigma-54-specific transcriptional regulator
VAQPPPLGSHAQAANGYGQMNQPGVPHDKDALIECLLSSGQQRLFKELERQLIGRALEKLNGNQLQTAKLLGITRNSLRTRMKKYGLRPKVKVV